MAPAGEELSLLAGQAGAALAEARLGDLCFSALRIAGELRPL